jgi:hypothetical protein
MKARYLSFFFFTVVIGFGFMFSGCSSKADVLKEVSGLWQDDQNKDSVEIQLVGDAKSMTVNGKSYPVNVENVQMDKYQVDLKVQNGGSQPEMWSLRQIWDDNGVGFNLALDRNGEKEILIRKEKS